MHWVGDLPSFLEASNDLTDKTTLEYRSQNLSREWIGMMGSRPERHPA